MPGGVTLSTTFFNVSAAVQSARPPSFSALARSTSVSIVGVSGVSCTVIAGQASGSPAGGAGVRTASVFAA